MKRPRAGGILTLLIVLAVVAAEGGELKPGLLHRAPDGTLGLEPLPEDFGLPPKPARDDVPDPLLIRKRERAAQTIVVCPNGCAVSSIGAALEAARSGDTLVIAPGLYHQGGVLRADRVTVKAQPGAHLSGAAVAGKAALVITGADTLIEGLECSAIAVPDGNGACVRLEGQGLTLRRVHFHDAEQGVLATSSGGEITIEDSRFERLGQGGRAHAIYVNAAALLTIRRSAILAAQGEGHEVKSRAARTVIEDSLIASFDGVDSRTLDFPNGGEVVIRNSVLEKGLNSSNGEMIGFGLEGSRFDRNSLTLDRVTALIDRPDGRLLNGMGRLIFTNSQVIGGSTQPQTAEIWVKDRTTAGLAAYPWVPATAAPSIVSAAALPRRDKRICLEGLCDYHSLAKALREATSGSTLVIAAGTYFEAGSLRANDVTLRGEPGAMIKGVAAEGKAALVIKGENTVIEGLECAEIAVPDQNGACVRLEGKGLILRRVYFHDSEQGVLAHDGNGEILIEDSRFERLGKGGRAHGLYVGTGTALTLRRTTVTEGRGQGHAVKSRSARTVLEGSTLATLTGADSRLIDVALGGELIVRDSLLEKGPGSDNAEMIGFGLEGRPYPVNRIAIENSTVIFDRSPNRVMRSPVHGEMVGGRLVASEEGWLTRGAGAVLDLILPGRLGSNLSFTDVQWFDSRQKAGVGPFPELPRP